jgi:hypothetical protein
MFVQLWLELLRIFLGAFAAMDFEDVLLSMVVYLYSTHEHRYVNKLLTIRNSTLQTMVKELIEIVSWFKLRL